MFDQNCQLQNVSPLVYFAEVEFERTQGMILPQVIKLAIGMIAFDSFDSEISINGSLPDIPRVKESKLTDACK